ncbi:penicillin-binding protein 2 [Paraferrimonas sp. SM1919]|uniref:penicillin-binding protein 2 n=1 Tax=Paraferrimonas sp. SM1919 TaxID=2662263 RepID=UPI001F08A3ED|nr:penicillin-binding protein 2 [Paraferrimonas sp. SM1919]
MRRSRVTIQNHTEEAALFKRRALFTFAVVVILISILLSNLYYLQVTSHTDYQTRANENRVRVIPVAPNRGLIFDRNNNIVANNLPVYSLEMIPEKVANLEHIIAELGKLFPLEEGFIEDTQERLKYHRRFKAFTLIKQLSEKQVAKFSINQHKFPGLSIAAGLNRYYPQGESLTHLLGYVARINSKDREKISIDDKEGMYAATNQIGKQGIEKFYEDILHGIPGSTEEEVNNRGRVIRTLKHIPPEAGRDLQLTIDITLQNKAIELLQGRRGAVVALDPNNGEILAMVSSPSYDPNLFVQGISSRNYSNLLNSTQKPLINRATQGQYAPASTVKPLLALAGLEHNFVTDKTKIWDPGFWQIPNVERKYRDWKRWGHGWVDLYTSVAHSCDIYFYDLAYKMGIQNIADFMQPFGFGESTGIDIHEESSAILPDKGWKRARYNQPWYIGDTISIGIGQGYWTATPIQLAYSTSILATKGQRFRPHLLKQVIGEPETNASSNLAPIKLKNEANWNIISNAMYQTAHKYGGSAYSLFKDSPYKAAVKSGTGQVFGIAEDAQYDEETVQEHLKDNALFVGWAPYNNPKIAVAVVLENAGWGSANAGPIAKGMFDSYLLDN